MLRNLCLLVLIPLSMFAADWRPVDPADLALKQSKSDSNADAEALFREVRVLNEQHGNSYPKNVSSEYVRIKIFTDRGKDYANVQIPYYGDSNIANVQGRTIHTDGSIVELAKSSIFEKVIEKRGNKTKLVSFALPAVETGSIIEYRFTEDEGDSTFRYRELEVQSRFPVDELTFFVKPLTASSSAYPEMRYMPFGCLPEDGGTDRDGFDIIRVRNVPAYHDDPYSPPEHSAKKWILVYYEENSKTGKDQYWAALGRDRFKEYSDQIKVNGEIKSLASQITSGVPTSEAKLEKLLTYCRTELKDVRGDSITTAELSKAKANHNALETLRRKQGDDRDIQMAFLALAQASGFVARRADLADRSTFLFGPTMQSAYFLNSFDAAVNMDGQWKFYDVTNPALPGGQLRWQEQKVYALITDSKQPQLLQTPMLSSKESVRNRSAQLTLAADGTLEGDVHESLSGNEASQWREDNRYANDSQREDSVRTALKARFADFDATNIQIVSSDTAKPVSISYHLAIRNYSQRTGKRLLVQPDFFAAAYSSFLPEASRHNNIYFDYPWGEVDSVDINLPEGFVLDAFSSPDGISMASTCDYDVKIAYDKSHHLLQYRRHFFFGDKDILQFDVKAYSAVKDVFDTIHEADNRLLTLRNQ